MSIVVKPWKPAEGCKSCKAAKRIMGEQMRHSGEMHGRYMKKIRELTEQVKQLQEEQK